MCSQIKVRYIGKGACGNVIIIVLFPYITSCSAASYMAFHTSLPFHSTLFHFTATIVLQGKFSHGNINKQIWSTSNIILYSGLSS